MNADLLINGGQQAVTRSPRHVLVAETNFVTIVHNVRFTKTGNPKKVRAMGRGAKALSTHHKEFVKLAEANTKFLTGKTRI